MQGIKDKMFVSCFVHFPLPFASFASFAPLREELGINRAAGANESSSHLHSAPPDLQIRQKYGRLLMAS